MTEIEKRNGDTERFNKAKIERSITNAGASIDSARNIALSIREKEDMTSEEIRRRVIKELKRVDPEAARRYKATRCLVARESVEAPRRTAFLLDATMRMLKLKTGDHIDLKYGNEKWTLKVQNDEDEPIMHGDICLNTEDMADHKLSEGDKLAVRRHKKPMESPFHFL